MQTRVAVIGGGLAGSEAAYRLARAGLEVDVLEMKPQSFSPAHKSSDLGELVCSNSLRSEDILSAVGLLKQEMQEAGSLIMEAAYKTRVPAGKALAVDRHRFSADITQRLEMLSGVNVLRIEVQDLQDPGLADYSKVVVAVGPLPGQALSQSLIRFTGGEDLYFYDAIAPIVSADSLNWEKVFWGSRYDPQGQDYLNCPLNEEEYHALRQELLAGAKIKFKEFEELVHFEGCLPVETLAERGEQTLAFGPMKPVGLKDPRTGARPFAVVQLRAENQEKTMFNLVGFQTKLTYPEQERIFRMIPGLEQARFERLGSMHRNTFVNAPRVLHFPELELKRLPGVHLAGQITGVEGYVESAACGLWVGASLARRLLEDKPLPPPPAETALGGLLRHLCLPRKDFQPMNVNFGLLPPLEGKVKKQKRKEMYMQRAKQAWQEWLTAVGWQAEQE
ncbi:MAG: methylenetetrahydrofolate--tRNA-(uracil(54)-C(5))-methyltransferase (FADH(2)-oxidizing) TrmFO [Desulfohalobiaceae bacterium]